MKRQDRNIVFVVALLVLLAACGRSKQKLLMGTWHVVKMENPEIDSFFINSQRYIDTMGSTNDPVVNMALYGSTNMDSVRANMQHQFDSARQLQTDLVHHTVFSFYTDSLAVVSFGGAPDTSKWHINKEGKLIMQKIEEGAVPEIQKIDIVSLSDTELVLKFKQDPSTYSVVTFHPEKK